MQRVCGRPGKRRLGLFLAGLVIGFSAGTMYSWSAVALGDEGMWLFNNPPKKILKEKYSFEPDRTWLDTCSKPVSASIPAARGRSCRPTAWC